MSNLWSQAMQWQASYVNMPEPDAEGRYKYVDHPGVETREKLLEHMHTDEHYGRGHLVNLDRRSDERLRDLHEWDHRQGRTLHEDPRRWTSFDHMVHRYRQHKDDPGLSPEDHALAHALGFEGTEPHSHVGLGI